jgi:hypothetical protein
VLGNVHRTVARVLQFDVTRQITQRELRNHSGEIMRQLDQGESFIVPEMGSRSASFPRCVGIDS